MRFLLDECLPHAFARRLSERGYPDAVHPIHLGLRSVDDHIIVRRAVEPDRIILTANAERDASWRLLALALGFIELQAAPADYMVNRVIEVSAIEGIRVYDLPPAAQQLAG